MNIFPEAHENFPLPAGFKWGATHAGIRYQNRDDVGIVDAGDNAVAAAVFTQNAFRAAPVIASQKMLSDSRGLVRGVVVNSGCANAATGEAGLADARTMAAEAAAALGAMQGEACLVCSTGTIGVRLPMEKVIPAVRAAAAKRASTAQAFLDFARAILTTDTREKYAWKQIELGGKMVTILACAKGSGMIYPKMATLLAFIATDVGLTPGVADTIFREAVEQSLNCLTVDADTSTNDTAIFLANGASGVHVDQVDTPEAQAFSAALTQVLQSLAKQLARDGEGATKLIEVHVHEAPTFREARQVALAIANSNLVKTAIYGRDANWGRIVCAVGNSGVQVNPGRVRVSLGNLVLFEHGEPVPFDEVAALDVLSEECVRIEVSLGSGTHAATAWTCDLTEKYIEINGAYRT